MYDTIPNMKTVLVAHSSQKILASISEILKDTYIVKLAGNSQSCINIATSETPPDLILLDISTPNNKGFEVCRHLKTDTRSQDIPIIFLTEKNSIHDINEGLRLGAADFISKPVCPPIVLARIKTQIENKCAADFLRNNAAYLERELSRRIHEVCTIQDIATLAIVSLTEERDCETNNHIRRIQNYVKALAEQLKSNPRFSDYLTDKTINQLYKFSALHDIGKAAIPDHILLHPGLLNREEFEIMKTHTNLGWYAIHHAEQALGTDPALLSIAKEIILCHHERWDGSGYPEGRSGEDIPIAARLMAVADVYDGLISRKIYKASIPHGEAVETINANKGILFDPDIVDAFVEIQDEFRAISSRFADNMEDMQKKADYLAQALAEHIHY